MAKKRANGEGNIRKRSDGRWEGRYTAGYHPDTGKRIIKNVLGRTQAEVKAKLKQAIGEAGSLDVARAGKYTVAEWLRLWFEVYAKPNLRFSTAEYYRRGIELHTIPYIGEVKLNQLTTRQIQNLYRELQQNGRRRAVQKSKRPGLSSSTIRGVHTMLHSALDRAVKEKLLLHNPAEDCVVPKLQRQEMRTLKPEDMRAYLEAAERRGVLALFYLELVSGIRKGELAALLWTDLDAEHGTILVSKQVGRNAQGELAICQPKTSNSVREISIPREAVELLVQEHQRHPESHYLFPSPRTGGMYHPDSIVNLHKKIDPRRSGPGRGRSAGPPPAPCRGRAPSGRPGRRTPRRGCTSRCGRPGSGRCAPRRTAGPGGRPGAATRRSRSAGDSPSRTGDCPSAAPCRRRRRVELLPHRKESCPP